MKGTRPLRTLLSAAVVTLLALLALPSFGASVVATVDRNQVGVNESFRLTFEADDVVVNPDFSVLNEHFEVLDRSQNQSISITNGQTTRKYIWDLVLMAREEGIFQIPPISFGGVLSQPVSIVVKAGAEVKGADKTIYLDVEVDVDQPYVQQQVMYTVRLFRSVEIASATLSELAVEGVDAIIEPFGDDANYQVVRNGRRWLVVERKYLVFPQQSGYLTIRPLEFRGQVVDRRSGLGLSLFNQPAGKPVVLRSESVTIAVREPPATFAGPWLPAKHLELEESWPEAGDHTIGEPVTRSITVSALGLTAAQLPELRFHLPEGLRAYPEQPTLENSGQQGGVVGSREQSMAIIPTRAGTLTLPEVTVAWWNVDTGQPEIATLPARAIEVKAAMSTAEPVTPAAAPVPEPTEAARPPEGEGPGSHDTLRWWPWVTLALGLAWLVTLVLWFTDRRRSSARKDAAAPEPRRVDSGKALAAVDRACRNGDAPGVRDALLAWGAAVWPEAPPANLGQLADRCGEPVSDRIAGLERCLYGKDGTRAWSPDGLVAQLKVLRRPDREAVDKPGLSLEPMYRT